MGRLDGKVTVITGGASEISSAAGRLVFDKFLCVSHGFPLSDYRIGVLQKG